MLSCVAFSAVLCAPSCFSQVPTLAASGTPLTTLTGAQVENSITGSHAFQSIHLSGQVTRDANPKETIPIDIVVGADGATKVTIQASAGTLTKTWIPTGSDAKCKPSGPIRQPNDMRDFQCYSIASWVLPTIAVTHSSPGPKNIAAFALTQFEQRPVISMDLYRRGFTRKTNGHAIADKDEERIVYLDPSSHLPIAMEYRIFPRLGSKIFIPVKVTYSGYRGENGFNVPHSIQKFVSGHLLLDISIDSVEVN